MMPKLFGRKFGAKIGAASGRNFLTLLSICWDDDSRGLSLEMIGATMPNPDDWHFLQTRNANADHAGPVERVDGIWFHSSSGPVKRLAYIRTRTDQRLIDTLTPRQQDAMEAINRIVAYLERDVAGRSSTLAPRIPGGGDTEELAARIADLERQYREWHKRCAALGIWITPALEIAGHGETLDATKAKLRIGWKRCKTSLCDALDVMAGIMAEARAVARAASTGS